jgi:hypothetical protein
MTRRVRDSRALKAAIFNDTHPSYYGYQPLDGWVLVCCLFRSDSVPIFLSTACYYFPQHKWDLAEKAGRNFFEVSKQDFIDHSAVNEVGKTVTIEGGRDKELLYTALLVFPRESKYRKKDFVPGNFFGLLTLHPLIVSGNLIGQRPDYERSDIPDNRLVNPMGYVCLWSKLKFWQGSLYTPSFFITGTRDTAAEYLTDRYRQCLEEQDRDCHKIGILPNNTLSGSELPPAPNQSCSTEEKYFRYTNDTEGGQIRNIRAENEMRVEKYKDELWKYPRGGTWSIPSGQGENGTPDTVFASAVLPLYNVEDVLDKIAIIKREREFEVRDRALTWTALSLHDTNLFHSLYDAL